MMTGSSFKHFGLKKKQNWTVAVAGQEFGELHHLCFATRSRQADTASLGKMRGSDLV